MPWQETSPGTYERPLGENEIAIKLLSKLGNEHDREHWSITSHAGFKPLGDLDSQEADKIDYFRAAWKALRFEHPSIAAFIQPDGKTLRYDIPASDDQLEIWACETFFSYPNTEDRDDLIPLLPMSRFATCHFFPGSNEVLLHTSHWRTDGVGILMLIDSLLEHAAHKLHSNTAANLAWGQETSRLTPSIEEAAQIPLSTTPEIEAEGLRLASTFDVMAGAVGLPYLGDHTTVPRGTRCARLEFSEDETEAVVQACKKLGVSVTSAVHAALAETNYALAAQTEENMAKHFSSTIRYGLRSKVCEPWCTPAGSSGLYTTGYMFAVPHTNTFEQNARAYSTEYQKGVTPLYLKSHRHYANLLSAGLSAPPPPPSEDTPLPSDVDISSFGIAESFVKPMHGTEAFGLEVNAVSVGVEIASRQMDVFVWTYGGKLNFNNVYNEAYQPRERAYTFVSRMKEALLRGLKIYP